MIFSPLFYVYRITFEDGATYVGQHIQRKLNDSYVTSSAYYLRNISPVKNREILIYVNDRFTLDLLETICIMSDKVYSPHNVNGNYGSYYYGHPFGGWNKGIPLSAERREKLRLANIGRKKSKEEIKKISESSREYTKTEEFRKKESISHKGKKLPQAQKDKISNSLKGIDRGDAWRLKMKEVAKKREAKKD